GGEQAVVAAEEVPRRRRRPRRQGPRLLERPRAFVPRPPARLGREGLRNLVVEDVVVPGLLVAGVRPPVAEELAGQGDHRRDEDEELDAPARTHERSGEAAERVPDDNDVAALPDRPHNGLRVLRPAGRLVVRREINDDRVVTAPAQHRRDKVPVPGASAAAVDERERGHALRQAGSVTATASISTSWSR